MVCTPVLQIGKQRDLSNIHRATQLLVTGGLSYDPPLPPAYTVNSVTAVWMSVVCLTFLTCDFSWRLILV